jgi:hypothetical protein
VDGVTSRACAGVAVIAGSATAIVVDGWSEALFRRDTDGARVVVMVAIVVGIACDDVVIVVVSVALVLVVLPISLTIVDNVIDDGNDVVIVVVDDEDGVTMAIRRRRVLTLVPDMKTKPNNGVKAENDKAMTKLRTCDPFNTVLCTIHSFTSVVSHDIGI